MKPISATLFVMSATLLAGDRAAAQSPYQYYDTSWTYVPDSGAYYTKYYYKTSVTVTTYRYHYVYHYPTQPKYYYYYNPSKKAYWGRLEIDQEGKSMGYSLLEEKDRKANLKDIPESAFPKPGELPVAPEQSDGTKMEPPTKLKPPAKKEE